MLPRGWAFAVGLLLTCQSAFALGWPSASTRVERRLRSPDVAVRQAAALEISELPRAVRVRLFDVAFQDPDPDVRLRAAEAALLGEPQGLGSRVVLWLTDPDVRIRVAAARILAYSPEPRAISSLGRGLSDPDPEVRARMAEALGASESEEAASVLLGRLDDAVPRVREVVARGLGRIGSPSAVVPLMGKMQDAQPSVRIEVIRALSTLGDLRAASGLILALEDQEGEVRTEALSALGALRAEVAIATLAAKARSSLVSSDQAGAALALAQIRSEAGRRALVELLDRELDPELLRALERAFEQLGSEAIPELEHCLGGRPARELADRCVTMLGRTGARKAAPLVLRVLGQGTASPQVALACLGRLREPAALSAVLEFLTHRDPRVRRAAMGAARELLNPSEPDGRAVEPVLQALAAPGLDSEDRARLIELLGRTGALRAAPVLVRLAQSVTVPSLRQQVIEALGLIRGASVDSVLLEALDDEAASVRFAAALALRSSGSSQAGAALLERIARGREQDRLGLALALAGPLSRASNPELGRGVVTALRNASDELRDALLEALAHLAGPLGSELLGQLAGPSATIADRAKVAEGLARHPEASAVLERLTRDPSARVRANAVWALGSAGRGESLASLKRALADRDATIAANAAAALARLGARLRLDVHVELCRALGDGRAYVRANALAGLGYVGARCSPVSELELLRRDPAEIVRARAARWAGTVPESAEVRQARRRCAEEDTSGTVSALCAHVPPLSRTPTHAVTVFVVPPGESHAIAEAPFALLRADGLMRLGITDRRGAVHEWDAPAGELTLVVPEPLAE